MSHKSRRVLSYYHEIFIRHSISEEKDRKLSNVDFPLILIYLGNKLPKYFLANLLYLRRNFSRPIILLRDEEEKRSTRHLLSKVGIELVEQLEVKKTLTLLGDTRKNSFKQGFWNKTLDRFLYLRAFMHESGYKRALHIEGDILISTEFPWHSLNEIKRGIWYPVVDETRDSGAVFFVGDFNSLSQFVDFVGVELPSQRMVTDMQMLRRFRELAPELVHELPTSPINSEIDAFDGIFDAAPWGQYLFGIDPYINRGYIHLYKQKLGYNFEPSAFNIKVITGPKFRVTNGDKEIKLFNLHIHSKDRDVFEFDLVESLNYLYTSGSLNEQQNFKFSTYIKQLLDRILSSPSKYIS